MSSLAPFREVIFQKAFLRFEPQANYPANRLTCRGLVGGSGRKLFNPNAINSFWKRLAHGIGVALAA